MTLVAIFFGSSSTSTDPGASVKNYNENVNPGVYRTYSEDQT